MREDKTENRHHILVIGVGSIGERHVRCFQQTNRATVSICEVNAKLRKEVARRYAIRDAFADVKEALAAPHDAVVVATPANLHVEIAQQAVEAGCHVMIEKPLSVSLHGVAEFAACAKTNGRSSAVAYVYRTHPGLAAMRHAITRGDFGEPLQLVAVAGQSFTTYRPGYRDTYYASRSSGGGAIQDALTHVVNAGEWLVGPIDRLVADADHKSIEGVAVEDVVHILARHGNVLASYALNQFQAPNEVTITVVCERGTARFEFHNHLWRRMLSPDGQWKEEVTIGLERDSLFIAQANNFLDAVDGKAQLLCSLTEGTQTLRANLAALKSVELREWQEIIAT
jgi:predicted dehydrogenase